MITMEPTEILCTLPPGFIPVQRYPGYYINIANQKLYSLKMGGVLQAMKLRKPNQFVKKITVPYYRISHHGQRRYFTVDDIKLAMIRFNAKSQVGMVPLVHASCQCT